MKTEKTSFLKTTFTDLTPSSLEKLISYLESIGGKPLKLHCRSQNAFKVKWLQREIKLRNRCHIQNAVEYLRSLKPNYKSDQIKVVIADLAKYVNMIDPNEITSFVVVSPNTRPSGIHFDDTKRLFYTHQIRDQNQNNYSTDLLTIYSLRLSLEKRVRGLLGIDYAFSDGKNIGLTSLIKIAKDLENVEYLPEVNWEQIGWIVKWLNHHMHRHIRPYPWNIHLAIIVLEPFVAPREPLVKGDRKIFSLYSAAYVKDELALQCEIEQKLNTHFDSLDITWLKEREVVTKR